MVVRCGSKFTRLKLGVAVNTWSEFDGEVMRSERGAEAAGMSHPMNPKRPWDWVWG